MDKKRNLFTKRKKPLPQAYDESLEKICEEIASINNVVVGYSKKFVLDNNLTIDKEIEGEPVIFLYSPIKKLIIPSQCRLLGDYITYWYIDEPLARIVHMNMKFEDGLKVKDYALYLDKDKIEEAKKYKYPKM